MDFQGGFYQRQQPTYAQQSGKRKELDEFMARLNPGGAMQGAQQKVQGAADRTRTMMAQQEQMRPRQLTGNMPQMQRAQPDAAGPQGPAMEPAMQQQQPTLAAGMRRRPPPRPYMQPSNFGGNG